MSTTTNNTDTQAPVMLALIEPMAVSGEQAAALLNMTRSSFYKQLDAGKIGPEGRHFGRLVRFSVTELRQWADAGMPDRSTWKRDKLSREGR